LNYELGKAVFSFHHALFTIHHSQRIADFRLSAPICGQFRIRLRLVTLRSFAALLLCEHAAGTAEISAQEAHFALNKQ
jgi:hypothetical protein